MFKREKILFWVNVYILPASKPAPADVNMPTLPSPTSALPKGQSIPNIQTLHIWEIKIKSDLFSICLSLKFWSKFA